MKLAGCTSWLLALVGGGSSAAQERAPIAVKATAEVDVVQLAASGRATLKLRFVSEATPDRPFAVRIELRGAAERQGAQ